MDLNSSYLDPALEWLEAEHPRRLAELLKKNQLYQWLEKKVDEANDLHYKFQEKRKNQYDDLEIQGLVLSEMFPPNPNSDREKPLTPLEKRALEQFNQRLRDEVEAASATRETT